MTEDANSTGNITWSVSSNVGATFKPQKGTLSPGGQNSVSILAPCKNDTFTFTGSGGVKPLTVSWTCSSPTITANGGGNCPPDSNGNYICTDTLALAQGSQGDLVWSSSSDLPGVTFSPPGGTLVPGQPQQVTVTIPKNECTTGHFFYAGQGSNTATVSWTCSSSSPGLLNGSSVSKYTLYIDHIQWRRELNLV